MKKHLGLGLFVAGLAFLPLTAKAEASFAIACDDTLLARGQTTVCRYSATLDPVAQEALTQMNLEIETGEGLKIEGFEPTANLWGTNTPSVQTDTKWNTLLTSKNANGISDKNFVVGEVTVILSTDAVECGSICIETTSYKLFGIEDEFTSGTGTLKACEDISIEGEETPENPDTGAFASYTMLAAGAVLSVGVILIARKNNKFYRI